MIKGLIKLTFGISLMYVTVGDKILPQAYANKSQEVRNNINEYLIGLFPDNKFETLKRDNFTIKG